MVLRGSLPSFSRMGEQYDKTLSSHLWDTRCGVRLGDRPSCSVAIALDFVLAFCNRAAEPVAWLFVASSLFPC